MNKTIISLGILGMVTIPMTAQETYQDTKMVNNDLNGTARYVGMGGAMEALGADISTISSNPAGIGLFRRSLLALSGGLVTQQDAKNKISFQGSNLSINGNKTNLSFDQLGFVWTTRMQSNSYLNVAFNYHKSRNFDQLLTAANELSHASQNKQTVRKYAYGISLKNKEMANRMWNAIDAGYSRLLQYRNVNENGQAVDEYAYMNASDYLFGQYQHGYIGEYDFNVSSNINDRVYLGLTVGFHDVNYKSGSTYGENLVNNGIAGSEENLEITGNGYNIKIGAIVRPIANSPFRIGGYLHTPIWYNLTMRGHASVYLNGLKDTDEKLGPNNGTQNNSVSLDYKLHTPWKFGLSLGHTVGNYLALGATYEYADYSTMDNRVIDGSYYDYDPYNGYSYYEESSPDQIMNEHTKATLKGVSTIKLGSEFKAMPNLAVRLGYNYVSPMFAKDGYRDGSLLSQGSANATSTNYTNWKSTNRITAGIGYTFKKFFADLAYQYSMTDGDFYPFMPYYDNPDDPRPSVEDNIPTVSKVSNKRHQLLVTLGYRF